MYKILTIHILLFMKFSLLKNFRLAQSDENFLRKKFLLVLLYGEYVTVSGKTRHVANHMKF